MDNIGALSDFRLSQCRIAATGPDLVIKGPKSVYKMSACIYKSLYIICLMLCIGMPAHVPSYVMVPASL